MGCNLFLKLNIVYLALLSPNVPEEMKYDEEFQKQMISPKLRNKLPQGNVIVILKKKLQEGFNLFLKLNIVYLALLCPNAPEEMKYDEEFQKQMICPKLRNKRPQGNVIVILKIFIGGPRWFRFGISSVRFLIFCIWTIHDIHTMIVVKWGWSQNMCPIQHFLYQTGKSYFYN